VWPGATIITLPDFATLQVKAWASETDVGKLKPGQRTRITLDAFPDMKVMGKVKNVSQVGSKRTWESPKKEFEVVVEMARIDERLKPGMTARASITIDEFRDVLSLPIECVHEEDGGMFVYMKTTFGSKKCPVSLGDRNSTHVLIKDGLKGGERVYLAPPEKKAKA